VKADYKPPKAIEIGLVWKQTVKFPQKFRPRGGNHHFLIKRQIGDAQGEGLTTDSNDARRPFCFP
jgi:hypothetical protein